MKKTIIAILFLFLININSFSQVSVSFDNSNTCKNSFTAIPLLVANFIDIDSFQIVINFDENIITNSSPFFGLHPSLSQGNINVNNIGNTTTIKWNSISGANIINDTLLFLKFYGENIGLSPLEISQTQTFFYTSSGILSEKSIQNGSLKVNSSLKLNFTEINSTCSNKCEANYLASITNGQPPYNYLWNGSPGRFDSIQTNLCSGYNSLWVSDANGCELDTIFTIDGLPAAQVEIEIRCDDSITDVIYLQNPTLTFSFKEVPPSHILEAPLWEFGDGDTAKSFNPTHKYIDAVTNTDGYYKLRVHFINENGCDTIVEKTLEIHEAKLRIPNIIIRNSDNEAHSAFIISDKEGGATSSSGNFISNQVQRMEVSIRDRWGRKVFSNNDYRNNWDAADVVDGVYFYTLKVIGQYKTDFFKGSITVISQH